MVISKRKYIYMTDGDTRLHRSRPGVFHIRPFSNKKQLTYQPQ